jgi:hypothetical protein
MFPLPTEELKYRFGKKLLLIMSKLQEKPSALKREHSAFQKMKLIDFFLSIWVIFALLDSDPDCESGSGYGSWDPIESGSTARVLCLPPSSSRYRL